MRFSTGCSFNSHDTNIKKLNGRFHVDQSEGVRLRCELSLNTLFQFGRSGATIEMITVYLNKSLKNANYANTDIRYAIGRLVREKLVSVAGTDERGNVKYRAGKASLKAWKKVSSTLNG